jgi:hypothetical protein
MGHQDDEHAGDGGVDHAAGTPRFFQGAEDFDLELIASRTRDANIQELTYRPTLHVWLLLFNR